VLGPFQIVTQENFASGIVDNTNSKHEELGQELRRSSVRIERAAQSVDDFEQLLRFTTRWQREDA